MKRFILLTSLVLLCGCSNKITDEVVPPEGYVNPFDFDGNFENPELSIDGKMDEEQWNSEYATDWIHYDYKNFLTQEVYECKVKLYRGESELYAFFDVKDSNILTDGNDNGNSVSNSDSVEIYLDTLNDGGAKPQKDDYQINLGVHGKTRVLVGNGSGWSSWTGLVQYESVIDGTVNDTSDVDIGYTVEMSIPYKQINIERDSLIGVTFGIVDKYEIGGGSTHKRWYGTTISGHYGQPQTPDEYFDYAKNTVTVAPLPKYKLEDDTTPYISDFPFIVNEITKDEVSYDKVLVDLSRNGSQITIRAKTEQEKWKDEQGLCISFDFGEQTRTARDTNTALIRLYPGLGSVRDFFVNPTGTTTGLSQKNIDLRISDQYLYLSFDYKDLRANSSGNPSMNYTYDGDIGVNVATIDSSLKVITSATICDELSSNANPSTWARLYKDNTASLGTNSSKYNKDTDSTIYANNLDLFVDSVTNNDIVYDKLNVSLARHGSTLTALVENQNKWKVEQGICFSFDIHESRGSRDENTVLLRLYPGTKTIKDFFTLGNNKALDQGKITVKYSDNACFVSFDYKALTYGDKTPLNYTYDGDIAFNVATLNSTLAVLKSSTYAGTLTSNANPSTWVRLSKDNEIIIAEDPTAYFPAKDETSYISNTNMVIPEISKNSITYSSVNISLSRVGNVVTVLAETTSTKWIKEHGLCFSFDMGAEDRTSRDTSTVLIRLHQLDKTVKDCFTLGNNKAVDQSNITIKYSEKYCYVSFDVTTLKYADKTNLTLSNTETIGVNVATLDSGVAVLTSSTVNGTSISNSNPSIWLRLLSSNAVK